MPTKPARSDSDMLPLKSVLGLALQLGFAVSTAAVIFAYGGHWLDTKFETSPLLFLIGIALGFAASMALVWRIVAPLQANLNKPAKQAKNQHRQKRRNNLNSRAKNHG